jgi:hypothetical protein
LKFQAIANGAGCIYNIFSKYMSSYKRDKFRSGVLGKPSSCCCSMVAFTRMILNILHVVSLAAALWLAFMITVQCVAMFAFIMVDEMATEALQLTSVHDQV